jgi:hypothetical protein
MIKWEEEGDNSLWLFTPAEFDKLPDGIELISISGSRKTKGKDYIDGDTRGGHLAFGVRNPFNHELKDMFLLFAIARS